MTDKTNPKRKRIRERIKGIGEWIKDRTGFFAYTDPKDEYHRGKTLWDWLQLLVIPAVFAGVGLWFNRTNDIRQEEIALDRQREEALQSYIDGMENLLLNKQLRASTYGSEVRAVAEARTFTVLRGLDGDRRGALLLFLYDAGLIGWPNGDILDDPLTGLIDMEKVPAIIGLGGAVLRETNLTGADLRGANLSGANLSGADLTGAYLWEADLWRADLTGANLSGADLREAYLWEADLWRADLTGADLRGADLSSADLRDAYLMGADLMGADLSGANLSRANLSGASLVLADLTGAVLEDAVLTGAKIDESTVLSAEQRKLFEEAGVTAEPGEE